MSGPRCNERGKVAFPSLDDAEKEANKVTWRNKRRGQPATVAAYVCPDCGMIHIGRGPQGRDAQTAPRDTHEQ
jgi:predicted RNA-binding Zn-ribbon protein involved in translation (DUF1610 family)